MEFTEEINNSLISLTHFSMIDTFESVELRLYVPMGHGLNIVVSKKPVRKDCQSESGRTTA